MGGRDADCGDEDLCAAVDRYGDEVVELAVGVVVICLASAAADLRQSEIDAEREGFIGEIRFEIVDDLYGLSATRERSKCKCQLQDNS